MSQASRSRPNEAPKLDPSARRQRALDAQRSQRHARFALARGELDDFDSLEIEDPEAIEVDQAPSMSKRLSRKWSKFADKLMYAEALELGTVEDLPLGDEWICAGPVPKGRRVLVLSTSGHAHCA